jgi:hypothetical protein
MPAIAAVPRILRNDRVAEAIPDSVLWDLVRYATLAASSHNTQPWTFRIGPQSISVLPDLSRRCPAVDPDDHHLFVSLGCATENLAHAALASGLRAHALVDGEEGGGVDVLLEPTQPVRTRLFDAMSSRQCTRTRYDGLPISTRDLATLSAAGQGIGVSMLLLTEKSRIETVLEYVLAGNAVQMADPAFVKELMAWIRFSDADAARTRDGLWSRCAGNPAIPRWLGRLLFSAVFRPGLEARKYAEQIRSSTGIAIFVSDVNDKGHWVEAGRCYERFALQATALGIRNAFLNQPVEVAAIRSQFARWLGIGERRPNLVVRFGRGPRMPRSFRRPVDEVLV